ncbi:MAG TPA: glycosyl hydrolase family 28-related protein [Pseudonocardiaceae bacterium]|jgi:hypothetical protein|nr:glycosyl hydrolase family 28-related protein [Pseudonocardiaceae bacterium]
MSLAEITVTYGSSVYAPNNEPAEGSVQLALAGEAVSSGVTVAAVPVTCRFGNGVLFGSFWTNGESGLQATVTENVVGAVNPLPYVVDIPTSGTLDLSTASRSTPPATPVDTYVLASTVGQPDGVATLDGTGNVPAGQLGNGVVSFDGRRGAVAPASGDYTAAQVGALAIDENLADVASASVALGNLGGVAKGALVFDVRDYGAVGNGSTNDATAIQNAVNAAATNGGTVYFPPGQYLVNTGIVPASNVALVGAGCGNTVILAGSAVSAINSTLSGTYTKNNPLTRFSVAHLSIDGTQQGAVFNVGYKGIFGQYLSECTFEDLVISNCVATGFGCDFLTNGTVVHNVRAIGNGRLNQGGGSGAGSSGIGIGTGQYTVEDFVVSDCFASTNGRYGFLFESQPGTTSTGARISNCFATLNYNHGFGDAGLSGAVFASCVAYLNGQAGQFDGFSIDNGTVGATAQPSGNSTYVGCEAISNTRYGFSYQPTANNSTSVAGAGNITYSGCKSYGNTSLGFNINSAASHPVSGVTYTGCTAHDNGASGWQVQNPSNNVHLLACRASANGQTSSTSKNGVTIGASVSGLTISGCRFYDDGGTQKQAYGLQVSSGATVTNGHVVGNDMRGNLTGGANLVGTLTGCYVDENPGWTFSTRPLWTPSQQGVIAATCDLMMAPSQAAITTGRLFVCPVTVDLAATANNMYVAYNSASAGVTDANSYLVVYSASGALLGATADIGTFLTTVGGAFVLEPLMSGGSAAPITGLAQGQQIYLGIINNYSGGTGPQLIAGRLYGTNLSGGSSGPNVTNGVPRWLVASGTYTVPPATLPSMSASNTNPLIGIGLAQ